MRKNIALKIAIIILSLFLLTTLVIWVVISLPPSTEPPSTERAKITFIEDCPSTQIQIHFITETGRQFEWQLPNYAYSTLLEGDTGNLQYVGRTVVGFINDDPSGYVHTGYSTLFALAILMFYPSIVLIPFLVWCAYQLYQRTKNEKAQANISQMNY